MEHVMAKMEHANLDIRVFDKSNPNGICAYLSILCADGAICVIDKHPAWYLCLSRSVGE